MEILQKKHAGFQVPVCPLAGGHLCDIPWTGILYEQETGKRCSRDGCCCPRVEYPSESRNELIRNPPRTDGTFFPQYGVGFGEPKNNNGVCVICSAGMRARCYLELGTDPEIRALIAKDAQPFTETYQELAERLLMEGWEKEKGP